MGEPVSESPSEPVSELMSEMMSEMEHARLLEIQTYLDTHTVITTPQAAQLLQVSDKTARRLLAKAESLHILTGEGKTKSKNYRKNGFRLT